MGKSRTQAYVLLHLMLINKTAKILACARTNKAVDEVLAKCVSIFQRHQQIAKFIRVYTSGQILSLFKLR